MYIILATLTIIAGIASASFYLFGIQNLRKKGWVVAQNNAKTRSNIEKGNPGSKEKEWLFAGPAANKNQCKHQILTHHPIYFLRVMFLFFSLLPRFSLGILRSSLEKKKLCYLPSISDEDIYNIFISGPLLVTAKMEGDFLEINIPPMPLKSMLGINPSSLSILFNARDKSIVKAEWQGSNILADKGKITTLLMLSLIMWAHPQTHIAAEISAREIARKNIDSLEPSNRFVVALHQGLLYSPFSPLTNNQPLSINLDKTTGVASASKVRMPHRLDSGKNQFRYYKFLIESRKCLIRLLKAHEISVNPEFLFNNIIVHSVDHYFLYQNLRKISAWSMDGGTSLGSFWRSQVFLAVWVRQVVSPIEEEKIRKLSPKKYPFYHSLYQELAQIDLELANCILASTSF